MALVLLGACGGEEREGAPRSEATDSAAAPTDTVAAGTPDTSRTTAAVKEESSPTPAPGSAVARRSSPAARSDTAGTPAPAPARRSTPARADVAADTAAQAAAETPSAQPTPRRQTAQRTPAPAPPAPATPAAAPAPTPTDTPPAESAAAPPPAAAGAPLRDQYHQAPRDTVAQVVYDGWKQYNLNCARCHGEDVAGTTIAPHLVTSLKAAGPVNTQESFVQVVCSGRPERGMPAWCPLGLEMEKINQIYSYVKGRSDGKIGPGRPAVRPEG